MGAVGGPVEDVDLEGAVAPRQPPTGPVMEVSAGRSTEVGGMPVQRALPRHGRRMVGAWCFLDRFGPAEIAPHRTMKVGPHPHMGLHTVTWLMEGGVLHTDSLGSRQMIRPGQLNLMTAGNGISHAEDTRTPTGGQLDGVQLWLAQPEETRHGAAAFAHHEGLPTVELGAARASVLLGECGGVRSPARSDWPTVGIDVVAQGTFEMPLDRAFEHGIAVLSGAPRVDDTAVNVNQFAYLGSGRDSIGIDASAGCRVLVLGGEPFGLEVLMWWNFVARGREELEQAHADWMAHSDRFGEVDSTLERIPSPAPNWTH